MRPHTALILHIVMYHETTYNIYITHCNVPWDHIKHLYYIPTHLTVYNTSITHQCIMGSHTALPLPTTSKSMCWRSRWNVSTSAGEITQQLWFYYLLCGNRTVYSCSLWSANGILWSDNFIRYLYAVMKQPGQICSNKLVEVLANKSKMWKVRYISFFN